MRTLLPLTGLLLISGLHAQSFHQVYGSDVVVHPSFTMAPDAFYLAHGSEHELIKIGLDGQVLWSRRLEFKGTPVAIYRIAWADGALLVAGGHAAQQNFLAALDADGAVLWANAADYGDIHVPTRIHGDGNSYLTVGHREYPTGGGWTFDITLCRWGVDGELLWAKAYGDDTFDFFGWASVVLPNGDILVAGERKGSDGSYPLIARFNMSGDLLWIQVLADGDAFFTYTTPTDLVATSDDQFALVATTYNTNFNYDPQVIKFDSIGNVQWAQRLYRVGWDERGGSIIEFGGHLLVSGSHALGDETAGHVVRFGLDGTPVDVTELPGFRSPSAPGYYTGLGQDLLPVSSELFVLAGECAPAPIGPSWHGLTTFSLTTAPPCFAPEAYPFEYSTVSWSPVGVTLPTVATDIAEVSVSLTSAVVTITPMDFCALLDMDEVAPVGPAVALHPNPSDGSCRLMLTQRPNAPVQVLDPSGRVVHAPLRWTGPREGEFDLDHLMPGVYTVRVQVDGVWRSERLVKR